MSVPAPRGDHDVDGLHDVGDQGLENSRERSCPSSSKTSATAGLISAAGVGWSARGANVDRARAVLIEQRGHHQGAPSVVYTDEQGLGISDTQAPLGMGSGGQSPAGDALGEHGRWLVTRAVTMSRWQDSSTQASTGSGENTPPKRAVRSSTTRRRRWSVKSRAPD